MAPVTTDRARPEAVLSHSASHLVTLDDLAAIPAGDRMGPHHRPVPHIELVSTVKQAFSRRGYAVAREQYSVSHENARLFGTLDLVPTTGASLVEGLEGGMAVGLRHANDQAFALGVIAGLRVFVCDNMAFSGGDRLLRRKHTTGLELVAEVERGLDGTFHSYRDLVQLVDQLRDTKLTDMRGEGPPVRPGPGRPGDRTGPARQGPRLVLHSRGDGERRGSRAWLQRRRAAQRLGGRERGDPGGEELAGGPTAGHRRRPLQLPRPVLPDPRSGEARVQLSPQDGGGGAIASPPYPSMRLVDAAMVLARRLPAHRG